jgi:hypothetical protein
MAQNNFTSTELYDAGPILSRPERVEGFEILQRHDAESCFLHWSARDRAQLAVALPVGERRLWMRPLAPEVICAAMPASGEKSFTTLMSSTTKNAYSESLPFAI